MAIHLRHDHPDDTKEIIIEFSPAGRVIAGIFAASLLGMFLVGLGQAFGWWG